MRAGWRLLLLWLMLASPAGLGYSQVMSEAQLKAAYLVNFLKYVEWPYPRVNATLCLVGRDSLGPALTGYDGQRIGDSILRVRRVSAPEQAADCQLIFISDSDEARQATVLRWVDRFPVLTVSDGENFLREGGAIMLVRVDGRLQFEVNAEAMARAGLKPSSQMMRLARQVSGGGR